MENMLVKIIIDLVAGLIGGNVAGPLNKSGNLGPVLNSILGAVGGIAGGQGLDAAGILDQLGIGGGTAGHAGAAAIIGALLPLIIGFFKKKAA